MGGEDDLESLADRDDAELQRRIREAFQASLGGEGEPSDWRAAVFDEPTTKGG